MTDFPSGPYSDHIFLPACASLCGRKVNASRAYGYVPLQKHIDHRLGITELKCESRVVYL